MAKRMVAGFVFVMLTWFALDSAAWAEELKVDDKIETTQKVCSTVVNDDDQPCYAGGKYLGNCSKENPYYHVFSGVCYATLEECKKADGDLSDVGGSGGCVRCGK